ncbi:hypothetical protein GH714_044123 [Hevea brasiliensis]|uniref:Uncharacterized protein n=1 Tax=Hevea brasiliensis TaxID=3981 RepID=A0A6A6K2P5_HEVBR|nr:hypothetical protein GH714_044123 [Hevea brasiliensis]
MLIQSSCRQIGCLLWSHRRCEIARDIELGEVREQPRLRAVAALHELIIATKGKLKTPSGMKGNLLTICVADSAGGKDRSQSHFKVMARDIKKEVMFFGRIASSKDIGRTLINSEGVATFIIDECHGLFAVMSQKTARHTWLSLDQRFYLSTQQA